MTTTKPFADLRLDDGAAFTNPRQKNGLDPESILQLACTIILHGLLSPLVVETSGLVLGGQRRYLAIRAIIEQPEAVLRYAAAEFGEEEAAEIEELIGFRGQQFIDGVPIVIPRGRRQDVALIDNIQREDLTSYEVAVSVMDMATGAADGGPGVGIRAIARRIGKDKSYVSRLLSAFQNASPELHRAWMTEEIPFSRVLEISRLERLDQDAAVAADRADRAAGRERTPRGSHGRPGVEKLKEMLAAVEAGSTVELTASWKARMDAIRETLHYALGISDEATFRRACGAGIAHKGLDKPVQ
jgi:ParB-like chromosome segregation protein Spo0J